MAPASLQCLKILQLYSQAVLQYNAYYIQVKFNSSLNAFLCASAWNIVSPLADCTTTVPPCTCHHCAATIAFYYRLHALIWGSAISSARCYCCCQYRYYFCPLSLLLLPVSWPLMLLPFLHYFYYCYHTCPISKPMKHLNTCSLPLILIIGYIYCIIVLRPVISD